MAAKYEDLMSVGAPAVRAKIPSSGASRSAPARDALADTLPPQPLKDLLSTAGANLFLLSADAELIDTVQRASGEQYPLFVVDDWAALASAVESGRCGVALLDTELVGARLAERIQSLEPYSNRVVILAAANRTAAQELMGLLSDRRIHRLLIKPATQGITRLLIESAVHRCQQLREHATSPTVTEPLLRLPDSPPRKRRRVVAVVAALLAVGIAVVAGVSRWRGPGPAGRAQTTATAEKRTDVPPSAVAAPGQPQERFAELRTRGAQAFDAGRLAAPPGDNALDDYLTILAIDPADKAAGARLTAVVEALFAEAESALLANSLDGAEKALAGVRRADPTSSRLAFLEAQLEKAKAAQQNAAKRPVAARERADVAAAGAAPAAPRAAAQSELDSLLVIADARLQRGQLVDPPGDSAREYLDRAAQIDAGDPRVVRTRAALAAALLDAARAGLGNTDLENAERFAAAARALGAAPEALAPVDADLAEAKDAAAQQRHAEWLALAGARLRSGVLTGPAGNSALDYLRKVQDEAPDFSGLAGLWDQWATAVAAKVREAIAGRKWADAEALLAPLERSPGAGASAPLREQLEVARLQEQYLAAAVPASELSLISAPPAVYPADALRRGIQGWVDLEFVVDRDGRPRDLTVVQAQPTGRFEQAALTAAGAYRYAPFQHAGRVYERRVQLRVRFTIN